MSLAFGRTTTLFELALLFFRLGATGFGGPAAHIAMMHDEVVRRRGWLNEERFLDLLGAAQLIPGPNSTELAIHIGWARRRWAGLFVAGLCFILPATLISAALAAVYLRFGSVPAAGWLLYGVKPVILGIVFQAIWGLLPKAAPTLRLRMLAAIAVAAAALGVHELAVLLGSGVVALILGRARSGGPDRARGLILPFLPIAAASGAANTITLPSLFWVFLKTGSVLFGSG